MTEAHILAPATGNPRVAAGTPTVVVNDVHVRYRVFADKRQTLRDRVVQPWKPRRYNVVHALKGVSLTAHAGEVIGVIGPNGSGKSTLMRVIAGVQPTAAGEVYARATPMLLGVGAVLNRQLSGRRNIILGGLALGMTRAAILEREEAIIEFAGIGGAIDLPMRTYSSGMSARLQFAISAAVEPEILIVDEALAVGDQAFKKKSNRRIRELRASAGTVFLVSHSVNSLMETCSRVIWLEDGLIRADGDPRETIREYRRPNRQQNRRKRNKKNSRKARKQARLRKDEGDKIPNLAETTLIVDGRVKMRRLSEVGQGRRQADGDANDDRGQRRGPGRGPARAGGRRPAARDDAVVAGAVPIGDLPASDDRAAQALRSAP